MQDGSEEKYQIATWVVLTIAALVIVFYMIIFLNPRIAFNPFKPPWPTATFVALPALQPTWTPTETSVPEPTATPSASATATLVVPPPPTFVLSTATTVPTLPPTATPRPPTRTPVPTSAAPPAAIQSGYPYRATLSCSHSGGTQIKGTVTSGGQPQEGVRVRVATSPDAATIVEEQSTRRQPDGSASYAFVLKTGGAYDSPAMWYVWIADGAGNPISDPNFHFQTNNYSPDNPLACWLAVVDFVK